MRKMMFLIVAAVLVSGGVYLAFSPAERGQPADPQSSAAPEPVAGEEPLGLCTGGLPLCNTGSCSGPGCDTYCELVDYPTEWTQCCDNGQTLNCSPGTVVYLKCFCISDGGGFCNQTGVRKYRCG